MLRRSALSRLGSACLAVLQSSPTSACAATGPAGGMAAAAVGAAWALPRTASSAAASTSAAVGAQPVAARRQQRAYATTPRTQSLTARTSAAAGGGGSHGRVAAASSRSSSSASGSSSSEENLRQLKGLGPAGEKILKDKMIETVNDLLALYSRDCEGDMQRLSTFLSEAGIRKQYSDTIAEALKEMAKAQPELVAAAERAAAEREAQKEQEAALGGEDGMVTLALEGNISAGKSTFLDVLSHEDTCLHDILKVVQEPVHQWQKYPCLNKDGVKRNENVLDMFYRDQKRFAYSFQHYVLMSRVQEDKRTRNADGKHLRVLERSIFSDRQVFVRAMHSAGNLEDFEVGVYNEIFKEHLEKDLRLVPDGFVYLRADPSTCMRRLKQRSRNEENGIPQSYLEILHRNHEDWLGLGTSARQFVDHPEQYASVLRPAREEHVQHYLDRNPGLRTTDWKLEVMSNAPRAIQDQVLLMEGPEDLPDLRHRLALVMDHDQDVDIHNDMDARRAYAEKIEAFYEFVQKWKQQEAAAAQAEALLKQQAAPFKLQNFGGDAFVQLANR